MKTQTEWTGTERRCAATVMATALLATAASTGWSASSENWQDEAISRVGILDTRLTVDLIWRF